MRANCAVHASHNRERDALSPWWDMHMHIHVCVLQCVSRDSLAGRRTVVVQLVWLRAKPEKGGEQSTKGIEVTLEIRLPGRWG